MLTPASRYDSAPADDLIQGDEAAVFADTAYDKKERRLAIKARGAKDRIMHKARRFRPLTMWQIRRDRLPTTLRSPIERTLASGSAANGYTAVRSRNLACNETQLQLPSMAFNLRRALMLQGSVCAPCRHTHHAAPRPDRNQFSMLEKADSRRHVSLIATTKRAP